MLTGEEALKLCKIDECARRRVGRGLCDAHYRRMRKGVGLIKPLRRANGSGSIKHGYISRSENYEQKQEHIRIAEKALGKPLPRGAEVHHVDENRSNNEPSNLVICPDSAYHKLLHQRMRALNASGHADWRKCAYCKQYDDPKNLQIFANNTCVRHRACMTAYNRKRNQKVSHP